MKKFLLFVTLLSCFSTCFVEAKKNAGINLESINETRQNTVRVKSKKYKMRAGESYFSKYDSHHGIKNSDADIEFDVYGLNVQLKGYSQKRADPFYYEELIDPVGNQN